MSVHYKFKAALEFSTVTFDGIHISVLELKKAIIDQKRLGKSADFDLQIINAQTKEVYSDENSLIPKNTSVIVARVPVTDRKKSGPPPSSKENVGRGGHHKGGFHQQSGAEVAKGSDLSSMDITEEEKIKAMMTQSTEAYDPSHYVRIRGANQHGRVPDNYRCNKCNQGGHWITRCPNAPANQPDKKKSTGIPRSFMVVVDSPDFPGALMTPEGRYAVPAVDHAAYLEKSKGQQTVEQPVKPKIPDDLVCPLCKDLLTDALLVPCCANSYCDDCIRNFLLESEHECPGCHEKDISPNSLIPNRFLRGTVNAFKSDTGYSKPEKVPDRPPKSPPKMEQVKPDESKRLSLDELPEDLFPHSPKRVDSDNEGGNNTDPESSKDLYDFNDGSIPSPFASPRPTETKPIEPAPGEQRAIQSLSRQFHGNHPPPPIAMNRGPPGGPPPISHHQPHQRPHQGPPGQVEPPPPGFDFDSGEDSTHRPHGSSSGPPNHGNGPRDGPPGSNRGQQPPMNMPPNVPAPFNPMQPPPGYHGGPGGPPGLPPPPGFGPPGVPPGPGQNMPPYSGSYNRSGPPHMGRGPGPGHHSGMPPRHHMDHDDYRGRGRRPYGHGGPPHRMDDPHRDRHDDETRPGIIDDPLKEFERLMREKDRRKKMNQSGGARKRSKSRSFSPVLRSPPRRLSPFPPKRSRSRSPFSRSRSPSPKRKRPPPPAPKRRRSYSRSPSRSPRPLRRGGKSRLEEHSLDTKRSRSRNRSVSPPHQGNLRRSPRRAPPQYSPSPPSRLPRKEKDDYFEGRGRDRYDDRSSRYPKPPYSSRDYDKYDGPPSSKYDTPLPPKHDSQSHKSDSQRQPSRSYHSHSSHGPDHEHPSFYRDKPADIKKPFQEFDPAVAPPGTDISSMPSLLDLNVPHPNAPNANVFTISTIGTGVTQDIRPPPSDYDKNRREREQTDSKVSSVATTERKKSNADDDQDQESDKDHKHKKSPTSKKHKKEKRKHKKKNKDEKKPKKRKSSKDERPADGEKSSDDDAETEETQPSARPIPVLDANAASKTVSNQLIDTAPPDSSFGSRQTVPDSTVKSPDRGTEVDAQSNRFEGSNFQEKSHHQTEPSRRASQTSTSSQQGRDVPETKSLNPVAEELRLPASKWDEYEDYLAGGDAAKSNTTERGIPVELGDPKRNVSERIVTPDVIKRAESLIFEKSGKQMAEATKQSPDRKELTLPEGESRESKIAHDLPAIQTMAQQIKAEVNKSSTVSSAVYRKSAKDRLGSKITEDEAVLNVHKGNESSVSMRSKVSAVGESSDSQRRKRSRSRSPYAGGRYRNRSRSRSLDRHINRSRQSTERQANRPHLDRDQKSPRRRDRRRSISRERRRSISRERRPTESRDRRNSRDRKPSPPRERAQRSPSKNRRSPSRDRRRSLSRDRNRRPSSRERRRPLSRDKDRRRSTSRNRRRSRSRSGDRRRARSRSRQRSPRDRRRTPSRDRDQRGRRPIEAPGSRDPTDKRYSRPAEASSGDQNPSPEARVFQQGGSDPPRADQVFSPTLKKQKGRINIKLNSISKAEPQQSGSSSSDDDHENTGDGKLSDSDKRVVRQAASSTTAKINTRPVVQSTVSVISGPIATTTKEKKAIDGVLGEDGKRKKKRTHSPTSSKSSSSSDTKRKKKKKDKKKKKKKKKSKE